MSKTYELRLKEIEKLFYKNSELDVTNYTTVQFTFDKISPTSIVMKKPYTIEEMIHKLEEHLMIFGEGDKEDCASLLRRVNYYTFKHYAQDEFGKGNPKKYKDVKDIYVFNQYLRSWLYDLLSHIELFLRTSIVDILSQNYSSNKFEAAQFYIDESIYFEDSGKKRSRDNKDRLVSVNRMLEMFGNTINDNLKRNEAIKHSQENYEATPAWILFDLLTLGQLSTFFNFLIPKYKKIVANGIVVGGNSKIPGDLLASWINAMRHLRNVVSHTGKVYGSNFNLTPKTHKDDEDFIKKLEEFKYEKRLIINLLVMRRIFLQMPKDMQLHWNDKVYELFQEIDNNKNIKKSRLGFIDDTLKYLIIE